MARSSWMAFVVLAIVAQAQLGASDLKPGYYASTCPNVESIVRSAVEERMKATIRTTGSTIRLFFHDCCVEGCDASVLITSTASNLAERDADDNKSLAAEGFQTVASAKEAVEAECPNVVSCADILAIATRDAILLSGGPLYTVELGRLDGLSSTARSVAGKLPQPNQTLDQLLAVFKQIGLNMTHLTALSAAHTVGLAHCSKFRNRLYNYGPGQATDPTMNSKYAAFLKSKCADVAGPNAPDDLVLMDQATPAQFDNQYYKNLQDGGGLLGSDELLYTDNRTRPMVDSWAASAAAFGDAFADAIVRLGRVGVKSGRQGNIRRQCDVFN